MPLCQFPLHRPHPLSSSTSLSTDPSPHPPSSHRLARTSLFVSLQSLTSPSPSALLLSAVPHPVTPSFTSTGPYLFIRLLSIDLSTSPAGPSNIRPFSTGRPHSYCPLPFPVHAPFPERLSVRTPTALRTFPASLSETLSRGPLSRGEAPFRGFPLLAGSPAAGPSPQQPEPFRPHGLCPTRKNLRRKPDETLFLNK